MRHRLLCSALLLSLLPAAAVSQERGLAPPSTEATIATVDPALASRHDARLHEALGAVLPGFAGSYERSGQTFVQLVAALTHPDDEARVYRLLGRETVIVDASHTLEDLQRYQERLRLLIQQRSLTIDSVELDIVGNRLRVVVDPRHGSDALNELVVAAGIPQSAIDWNYAAPLAKASTYGICPANRVGFTGPKRIWRDSVTNAYLRDNYNEVWWLMKGAATASGVLNLPMGATMLNNFLDRAGNVNFDYTGPLADLPSVYGRRSGWISNAAAVRPKVSSLDNQAISAARSRVQNGSTSGTLTFSTSVETVESVDSDLYFALGKFNLQGTYKYSVQRPWLGTPYIKVERVYDGTDVYNWDPPRQCGIIDHIVPYTLAQRGQAANFSVRIRWGEPEFKLNL